MQNHPKTYEDVFSSDHEKSKAKLKLEAITISDFSLDEYISLFHNFLTDFYSSLFLSCVKISWLRRKFTYHGYKTILPMYKNSRALNDAFVKLMRRHIGHDLQIITKGGKFFSKIESYFNELFQGFEEGDPFENPDYYKFPFNNITMEYMLVVYQLDDRMSLLKKADEKGLSFAKFLDYVINYVYNENDRLGRRRYEIRQNRDRKDPFFIRDTDKETQPIKNKKRL
jgi:hypothetical protein